MNKRYLTRQKLKALLQAYAAGATMGELLAAAFDPATTDYEALEWATHDVFFQDEAAKDAGLEVARWLVQQPTESFQKAGAMLTWSIAQDNTSRASTTALVDMAELMFAGRGWPIDQVGAVDRLYRALYTVRDDDVLGLVCAALARVWALGKCGLVDHDSAFEYFRVAAALDVVEPAYATGLHFDSPAAAGGRHNDESGFSVAAVYYSIAYEAGHSEAGTRLGIILTSGVVANADVNFGFELLEESAGQRDEMAIEALRKLRLN